MTDFKARIGREVPPDGKTRVVFSIRTARGNRLELDGVFDEEAVLEAWQKLHAALSKQGKAVKL
jgi:hypothetical protein